MDSFDKKIKVLVVLGMGGHSSQILRLVSSLGDKYDYSYVIGHDDKTSEAKIKFVGPVHTVRNPRLMIDKSIFKVFFNMFPSTVDVFKLLFKVKPDVIISSGPSLSIHMFWLAKLFGIRTVFLESWVRVKSGSATGKLVYPVSDLFLVQWEEMVKVYPKAKFCGRLS